MKKTRLFTFIACTSFLAFTSLHSAEKDNMQGSTLCGDDEASSTRSSLFDVSAILHDEEEMKEEGVDDQYLDDEYLNDDQKEYIDDSQLLQNATRFAPQCKRKKRPFDHKSIANQFDISFESMAEASYQKDSKHKKKSIRLHSTSDLAQMINEELEIVDRMPECIEKYVYQLQIYLKLFKLQKEDKNSSLTNLSFEDEIEETLQNCIINSQKKQIIRKILRIKQTFRQEWKVALKDASKVLREIQPLHLERVFHLIQKADLAKDQVVDKDVILLLGGTGAGKSTAIFTLVGCTMEEQQIDNLTHIGPKHIPSKYKEHLKGITSSRYVESQTRYISAVPVKLSDMNVWHKRIKNIVLCDTPGFDDIAGPEVELANGKGVIEALKKAKSVKFLILIPFAALEYNRMRGVRNLVHTLTKLIPSIEDHFASLIYVFTKTTEKQEKEIDGLFKNMVKVLDDPTKPESKDENFVAVFNDIAEKHEEERTIVLRPLETNIKELWKKVMAKDSEFIEYPEEVLQPFTTSKSHHALSHQIAKLQNGIQEAIKAQNYKLLQYKLNLLQKILQLFPQNLEIKLALDESIQKVTSTWNKKCHETYAKLQEQLKPYRILHEKDVSAYKELLGKMKSEEGRSIQKQLSGQKNSGQKNKEDAIGYAAVQQQFRKQIESFVRQLEKIDFEDPCLLPQLKKLRTITKTFKSLQSIADKVSEELLQRMKKTEKDAQNSISNRKFKAFLGDYHILHEALPIERFLRKNPLLPKALENLQKNLQDIFKKASQKSIRYFPQNNNEKILRKNEIRVSFNNAPLSRYNIKEIKDTLETIDTGIRCFATQDLFAHLYEQISSYQTELFEAIHIYIEGCQVTIKHIMLSASEDAKSFVIMKNYYESIEKIREIESVREETIAAYYSMRETFHQCFRQVSSDTSKTIQEIFSAAPNTKKKVKQLIQCVKCIQNTGWFDKKGGHERSEELLQPIKEELLFYLKSCQKRTQKMTLDIDHLTQCKQACDLYCILDEMQALGHILSGIKKPIQEIRKDIERCIQATCSNINTIFNVKKASLEDKLKLKELLQQIQEVNKMYDNITQYSVKNNINSVSSARIKIKNMTDEKDSIQKELREFQKDKKDSLEKTTNELKKLLSIHSEYASRRKKEAYLNKFKEILNNNEKEITAQQYLESNGFGSAELLKQAIEEKEQFMKAIHKSFEQNNENLIKNREKLTQELKELKNKLKHYIDLQKKAEVLHNQIIYQLKNEGYEEKRIKQWFSYPTTVEQKLNQLMKEIEECKKRKTKHKFDSINPRKIEQVMDFIKVCSSAICNDQLNLLFTTYLEAAQEEVGTTENEQSCVQSITYQEEKKEDPEDSLQNDPPFHDYDVPFTFNQQQEKPIRYPLDRMPIVQNQPVDNFEITQCIQQTKNNFTEFLDQYADSFTETIRVSFHLLSNHSSLNLEEISEEVEGLISCLDTLQKISIRTSKVFKKLFDNDSPLEAAQDKLKRLRKDIGKKVRKEKQERSSSLHHTLQVVEYLIALDDYLLSENQSTFSEIYQTNSQAFYSDVIELPKVDENMNNKNYKAVAKSMRTLLEVMQSSSSDMRARKALESLRRTVEQYLKKRIKATFRAIVLSQDKVDVDTIFDLQNDLTILDSAMETFCPNDCNLLGKSSQNELIKQKKRVSQKLATWMKGFITKIETFIHSFDFLAAEKYIHQLNKINQILGENMIETDENDKDVNLYKEIVNEIKKVEEEIQKKLQEQIDYYKTITLYDKKFNPYAVNPPIEFCRKLKAAQSKHGRYTQAISSIQRDIFQKVRRLMMQGLKDPRHAQEKFNLCENVLTSLPEEWCKALEKEMNQEKEKVEKLKKKESERIEQEIESSLIHQKCKILQQPSNDSPLEAAQDKLKRLRKDIDKEIREEKEEKSPSLNHMLQVVEYITNLNKYPPEKENQKKRLTFSQIYQTNPQASYSDVIVLFKVHENMENKNYKAVANSMRTLLDITQSSSNDMRAKKALQVIQREVEKALKKRIKGIRRAIMLSENEVNKTAILDLQNNLATLDSAMETFCDYNLLEKSSQNELFKQKKQIYRGLTEWMKGFITKIETFIRTFNFLGAEEYIHQLKEINQILGENMIETDENDKDVNPYKEIVNKIKKVENGIQNKLQEQIDYYKKITLYDKKFNPYAANPPIEFCLKLKAAETKHSRYSEAISSIKRDIFDKVRKLMMQGLKNPMQTKKCFNLCRNILTSLPKEWAKTLEMEIKLRSEEAKEREEQENARIMNIIATGVTKVMYQLLRELKRKGDIYNASKVEKSIRRESESKYKNIKGYINEGNIQKACYQLTELYQDKCLCSDLCPFIQKNYESARSDLSIALKTRTNFLKKHLSSSKENNTLPMEKMRTCLEQIQQFENYCAQLNK